MAPMSSPSPPLVHRLTFIRFVVTGPNRTPKMKAGTAVDQHVSSSKGEEHTCFPKIPSLLDLQGDDTETEQKNA